MRLERAARHLLARLVVRVRRRSLIGEILALQLAAAVVVGAVAFGGLWWASSLAVQDHMRTWGAQWLGNLDQLGALRYMNNDAERNTEVHRYFEQFPEVLFVRYYSATGWAIAEDTPAQGAAIVAPIDPRRLDKLASSKEPQLLDAVAGEMPIVRIAKPIWDRSRPSDKLLGLDPKAALVGYVELGLDFTSYRAFENRAIVRAAAIGFVVLLALMIASWLIYRRTLRPLAALQAPLKRLAKGETDFEVTPSGHREIVAVANALKATASALDERDQRLSHLASRDELTGLIKRSAFQALLAAEMEAVASSGRPSALLCADLDQFKYVNDTCGHAAGDHLLQLAAQQLRYAVRAEDFVARFGGDEFVVLVRNVSRTEARTAAAKVLELMRGLKHVEDEQVFHLQCSIGVALLHGNRLSAHEVIAQSDIACRSAKARGRNRVEIYSAAGKQSEQIADDVTTMNRLRKALETDRFELMYQPLMHVTTRTVSHYETLLRLPTESGVLRPESFLPAAFRFGLMADIDRWVLKRAVQSLAELMPSMPDIKLSTNLSGFAFEDEELAAYLRAVLKDYDVPGDRLILEITEQLAVRFAASTDRQLALLRELGCQLAIDDFGSGYSSFTYLKRLPVDFLKIDGAFIKSLARDKVDQAMVRMVGEVARAAGIETVAEYVNSQATFDLLAKYGIDYAQGYFIGKPIAQPVPSNVTPISKNVGRAS